MALLIAAATLVLIGAFVKKGHALSFLGALTCALAALSGLLSGAGWQEALLYVLLTLALSSLPAMVGRGSEK
ncbi:MAG: hypothetical protein IJ343_14660 [Clostridia bacterium]|nr:hypothetical protein [Clostridia bacterium]